MESGIKLVNVCACDWLLCVFVYVITYVLNYLNILRFIQLALSRQRWMLSSCAQQTPWCKLQGIAHGHIPFPNRQYQQVYHWQPMVRKNHPKINRTWNVCVYIYIYN